MKHPLVTRPPYGEGRLRTPRAVAELPEGGPSGRGLPLDDGIPGTQTFTKPLDDNGTSTQEQKREDESIYRVRGPRDLPKDRDRVDVVDQTDTSPAYVGKPGKPHESPKTKYPYRDGKPNTHNASAEFVAGMWALKTAPERLLLAGQGVRVAAPVSTLVNGLNPKFVQRAAKCNTTLKRADIKNLRWIFAVNCGSGDRTVKFKAVRQGNVTKFHKMDMHVACSCPAWRWQGPEFHSTTKDYQDPRTELQGTASPPDIRDPERQNMVCKHVAAAISFTQNWTIPKQKG